MVEAKRRNPDIKLYALPWGFPGWVAEGGSSPMTNSTVEYIVKWLTGARTHYGLHIDYVGVWNEKELGAASRRYVIDLHAAIRAANLSTLIVGNDDCCGATAWGICPLLARDAEWLSALARVGGHYPSSTTTAACEALSISKWSSEDSIGGYTNGPHWSREISRNYVQANLTATVAWNLIAAYDDDLPYGGAGLMHANNPFSGYYEVDQVIWATAHTCQFTRPGWFYLGHGSGVGLLSSGGSFVSLTNGKDLTIIVEAMPSGSSAQAPAASENVTFQLTGAFASLPALNVFHSNFARDSAGVSFRYEGTVQPVNGAFSFVISTSELYTFSTVNGSRGDHGPTPRPAAFPLPYSDDFESYEAHHYVKYLTDQSGSFEVVQSNNTAHGKTLRQMMPQRSVGWCGDADLTFSVIGNHSWSGIQANVDVMIERSGTAFLALAVAAGGCVGRGTSGITLAVSTDGSWTVANRTDLTERLATGKVAVAAGQWLTLRIRATPLGSTFTVNGNDVATLANLTSSRRGWVAIGSSYDYCQFDNLHIQSSAVGEDADHRAAVVVES